MMDRYMSIKQLAEYSSLHPNTLKMWLKRGMPHYRFGRRVLVKRSEFDLWMKENFQAGGTTRSLKAIVNEAIEEVLK